MVAYSVAETKTHLCEIIKRVECGEEVTITRRGEPVAMVGPIKKVAEAIDWKRIAEFRRTLPKSTMSAANLIREMRDAGF